MDYLIEAKKFVQRAHEAAHPEVIKQHLKMAEWYLSQAIEERNEPPPSEVHANRTEARSCPDPNLRGAFGAGRLLLAPGQRLVTTTSRYSPGTTSVPSSATLIVSRRA